MKITSAVHHIHTPYIQQPTSCPNTPTWAVRALGGTSGSVVLNTISHNKANQLNMIHQKVVSPHSQSKAYTKGQSNTKHHIMHKVSSSLPLSALLEYAVSMRKGLAVDRATPQTLCSLTVPPPPPPHGKALISYTHPSNQPISC